MRLFLDDDTTSAVRKQLADGYDVWVTTAPAAIELIKMGHVSSISLDHDLGAQEAGTGYDVAKFIEEKAFYNAIPRLTWRIHSANPVGESNMRAALKNADDYWTNCEQEKDK